MPRQLFGHSGNGHSECEVYCYQVCDVYECLCHECWEDYPDSFLVVSGASLHCSSPEELWSSTCLHFSVEWIILMMVVVTDIVQQPLVKITCSHAAMEYRSDAWTDCIDGFWAMSPTEIWKVVAWLLLNGRFPCSRKICEVSSKFPSC